MVDEFVNVVNLVDEKWSLGDGDAFLGAEDFVTVELGLDGASVSVVADSGAQAVSGLTYLCEWSIRAGDERPLLSSFAMRSFDIRLHYELLALSVGHSIGATLGKS